MAELIFDFDVNKIVRIFEEDEIFFNTVISTLYPNGEYDDVFVDVVNPNRELLYTKLATLLLENNSYISDNEIDYLYRDSFLLYSLADEIFEVSVILITEKIYKQIIFTYKFSTVNHFFQNNYLTFLPEPESMALEDNEKLKIHHISLMREFDRFSDIIDSIYDITDVDKVDNDYLNYLVQLVGYEKNESTFLTNDAFRQLAKNIIEIYRIKGTTYSIELFFNFLGLKVIITECWFDKRLYYSKDQINKITSSSDKSSFAFYLTNKKPTDYIPELYGFPDPNHIGNRIYQVMDEEITSIKSDLVFDKMTSTGTPVLTMLEEYTYFKTNYIQYAVSSIRALNEDAENFNETQLRIISDYLSFLIPIFIKKNFSVNSKPIEDSGEFFAALTEDLAGAITRQFFTSESSNNQEEFYTLDSSKLIGMINLSVSSIEELESINEIGFYGVDVDGYDIYIQEEYSYSDFILDEMINSTKIMPVNY